MTDKTQQAAMEREALTDCVEALKAADSETRDLYYNHPAKLLIINALDKARAALSPAAPAVGAPVAEGMALVPDYRGYARLGTGQYVLNNSANDGEEPELIISIATEEEKAGRTVGEMRDNPPGRMLQPEEMCVRIRFANVAGLDALENQLRLLREECFASPPAASLREQEELEALRRALEVIAVGDSKDTARDAADVLVAVGWWNKEAVDAQRLGREKGE